MRKYTILVIAIVFSVALILSFNSFSTGKASSLLAIAPTPYPTISAPEDYLVVESSAISDQSSRNIEVISPIENDIVKSGFVVKGNARTKDNTVVIRLSDSSGNILSETTAIANSPNSGNYCTFEKLVLFSSEESSGKLDVFQFNNDDGTIYDVVTIPLNFN